MGPVGSAVLMRFRSLANNRAGAGTGLRISTKLVAGFATISLIAVLVGVAGLYFIDKINSTLNNITDVAAPTVETSDDLIMIMFEATKVAKEIIAEENPEDIDELVKKLEALNGEFVDTYKELQGLVSDESLLDELETARNEQAQFVIHANRMIVSHRRELSLDRASLDLLSAFDAAGGELTAVLDEFAVENEAQMARAEEEGDRLQAIGAKGDDVNRVLGNLFDRDYPVVEAALKLQRLIIEMQDTAGEYIAEAAPENLKSIEDEFLALFGAVQPHLDVLRTLAETPEDRVDAANLSDMLEKWAALADGANQLFDVHRQMLEAELLADELTERFEADADNVVAALDQVAEAADAISDGADDAAAGAVEQANTAIFLLLVLALIGSVMLLALIVLTVVRPIKKLTGAMASLSAEYGQSITPDDQRGDEVRQLRAAFDHLIHQVQQRTDQLQERSKELDGANQDLERELDRRRSLEEQLVHAQKLDGLGTLAGGIAHDFNNMLYVILGCSEIALNNLRADDETRQLVLKIDKAARRSKSIVRQILFFSRQHPPNRKPLDVGQSVVESATLLRAGLPTSMILEVDVDDECGTVLADESQIQQLTVNLVTNASQAYADRKGTVRLSARRVEVEPAFAARHLGLVPGPYVCLTVADEGEGIAPDILPKIYDPFFTTKPVGEGTGLGLAVVHGIVAAHDGVIDVSTDVGRGTTVNVYLPALVEGQQTAETQTDGWVQRRELGGATWQRF